MKKHIGFVSTRFAGTDGVTLEASKWASILNNQDHECFWFAGVSDRNSRRSMVVPEAHFLNERNRWINERILGRKNRLPEVTDAIHDMRAFLKNRLREFLKAFEIELLIVENALAIPMHLPLGLAITEVIAETRIPTIAHHHDFYWERTRYSVNAVGDYLRMAFPPPLYNIEHVVINTPAQEELAHRKGLSSVVIPNVLDFENPPAVDREATRHFRQSVGLGADDLMILQPTRVVARKGIEHAINLVKELNDPRYKLVISHEAGDEGQEYAEWLKETAKSNGVELFLAPMHISDPIHLPDDEPLPSTGGYSLWDVYPHADLITYPSLYEGFGNAFLEAVYFKKPLLINRYAIFVKDIEPLGFDLIQMDGYLTRKNIRQVKEVLESPERRRQMTETNYQIAKRHYSYAVLRNQLNYLLHLFFGINSIGPI